MSIFLKGQPPLESKKGNSDLPLPVRHTLDNPADYITETGLTDAVDMAIILGQPLLLTGEAGTGKTLLAYVVGNELGLETYKFETKSTSAARDLFYLYDTVGRFQAKQTGNEGINPVDYLTYNALGKAILQTLKKDEVNDWLPQARKEEARSDQFTRDSRREADWQRRSIVLIDEIDKAPRDFPNDILNEIENMYFKIPELGNKSFVAAAALRPLVFITSNSEKHLPDAFLRRCIFYNIDFPKADIMKKIIERRVGRYVTDSKTFLNKAVGLFYELREPKAGLQKKPATAELLGWIIALKEMNKDQADPLSRVNEEKILSSLSVLIKNTEDIAQAKKAVVQWLRKN
ncbi:MAG: MoxR family ATPase [Candidatus Brocadia sp.]|uniref:ATPase family associated with various cellular activities (AAA) n=1 Tax=Candidatus Brocadia fulgida TaxID=380242 RepID=A0A0M2UUH6_9BACT|nr:MAG: ATPase family associated with various cellular activities (AAA) [Candidatus Brocadia fulgida]UJS20925.1 MAG: MoxR family ATPase [Candidatus Brocadia sp.]